MLERWVEKLQGRASPAAGESQGEGLGAYTELLAPIEGDPTGAGSDLGYEDEYAAIQDQVAKRGDIDDSVIQSNAILLLGTRGKDLRAAVFLAYSALRADGLDAATELLALLRALVLRYGDALHPRKPAARRAALEWLCNERFIDPLSLRAERASEAQLLLLQSTVAGLVRSVLAWPVEARPDLSGLTRRVEQWLDRQAHEVLRQADAPASASAEPSPLSTPGSSGESAAPKSAQEAWGLVRKAATALRADPRSVSAGRVLLRQARWASVAEAPPHQAGVTRFAAPRKEARAYLEGLHAAGQWEALLDECTRVFNEASNHLWLDLQRWSDAALQGQGQEPARAQLALDLRTLLHERLPLLDTLAFDDGLPFASPGTRAWLQALMRPQTAAAAPGSATVAADPALAALHEQAAQTARKQGLGAGLALLQARADRSLAQQERFLLQGAMVSLAREQGRADLALSLARERAAQVESHALARWQPELAFAAWSQLYALLRVGGEAAQAEAQQLHARLCGLDARRAAELI